MTINRKIRMVLSILMCCAVLLSATSFAVDDASKRVISSAAASFFEEHGIPVSRTAIMDIVPLQNDKTGVISYALRLTELKGTTETESLFVFYGERSDGTYGVDSDAVFSLVSPTRISGTPVTLNSDIVINSNYYRDLESHTNGPYHRPKSLNWSYYKLDNSVTVSYIYVKYATFGILYNFPSFTTNYQSYTHNIGKGASNPTPYTSYSNTSNPLSYSYVIDIGSGGGGLSFTFNATIDGTDYEDSYLTFS